MLMGDAQRVVPGDSDISQLLLKGLENISNYAMLLLDSTGSILYWNKGAELLYGHRPGEIEGSHFSKVYR